MSKMEIDNPEDGSFGDHDTEVTPLGGECISVSRREGSGYGEQRTTAYLPVGLLANLLRAQGFVVTATDPSECAACKRFADHRDDARFPQYRQMYVDNLVDHLREVHGQVTP